MQMMRSFRRKFSISAPMLSVRPHVPWYVRWAIILPFILLFALVVWWAYGSGLELAGFHRGQADKELGELREMVQTLKAQNVTQANQLATYERQNQIDLASTQGIEAQLKSLNDENARLKEDLLFYDNLPLLLPHADARGWFAGDPALAEETAFRNSSIQGGYFIIAARAVGLDCGPMSGFDRTAVDAAFLAEWGWKSNFLINLGHGDPRGLHARNPRLGFNEACRIV